MALDGRRCFRSLDRGYEPVSPLDRCDFFVGLTTAHRSGPSDFMWRMGYVDWCVHEQDAVAGVADVASLVSGGTFLAKGSVARHTPAAHSTKNRSADRSCRQRRLVSAPLHFAWVKLLKSILDGVSCRHEDRRRRLVLMAILDRDQTKITESIARDECGPRLAGCQAIFVAVTSQPSRSGGASVVFSRESKRSTCSSRPEEAITEPMLHVRVIGRHLFLLQVVCA
jgi:hypothetical protein